MYVFLMVKRPTIRRMDLSIPKDCDFKSSTLNGKTLDTFVGNAFMHSETSRFYPQFDEWRRPHNYLGYFTIQPTVFVTEGGGMDKSIPYEKFFNSATNVLAIWTIWHSSAAVIFNSII